MFSAQKNAAPANGKLFVEDVFSTYLYTGNETARSISNGIDLAGKGGLVWIKTRTGPSNWSHCLADTARGPTLNLSTNNTGAAVTTSDRITSFNSDGFSIGNNGFVNQNGPMASWTFREAPKFFDVVTYTGNGVDGRQIAHSLGSTPGMMIVKCTSNAASWPVYHRSLTQYGIAGTGALVLNNTNENQGGGFFYWDDTDPTSTVFTVGNSNEVNTNGQTYVAYLFAHDAGGFGPAGTDSIIQCGSYTGTGVNPGPTVTLGWEPQWLMIKRATGGTGDWYMFDNMRGMTVQEVTGGDAALRANVSGAEFADQHVNPTSTGFQVRGTDPSSNANGSTYIYIAIRRGPMRTPTLGTSVFSPNAVTVPAGTQITSGFPVDMTMATYRLGQGPFVEDRLIGISTSPSDTTTEQYLRTTSTAAEASGASFLYGWNNTGFLMKAGYANAPDVFWSFRRAPGFFDEVCYTGTGSLQNVNHNLGVEPEMMIVKRRDGIEDWYVTTTPFTSGHLILNLTNAKSAFNIVGSNPTSTTFAVQNIVANGSGRSFVAYLFASCPGVSKVGSYTGNGSSQTINCGFAAGARFVLIKRTDSTGDWYVWDTARGIVAGNDPHLSLNTTAAEVTSNDTIDTDSSGFVVNQVAATNVNVSSATYIYIAIA
jgi:hypothetical protein